MCLCLPMADRIPTDFHSQLLCGCLFLALVLWTGELGMDLSPQAPQEKPLQLRCPLESQPPQVEAEPALFTLLPFYQS